MVVYICFPCYAINDQMKNMSIIKEREIMKMTYEELARHLKLTRDTLSAALEAEDIMRVQRDDLSRSILAQLTGKDYQGLPAKYSQLGMYEGTVLCERAIGYLEDTDKKVFEFQERLRRVMGLGVIKSGAPTVESE